MQKSNKEIEKVERIEIYPLIGIGQVKLGDNRESVRKIMGGSFSTYKNTENSVNYTDAYLNDSFQVFYDKDDRVEFIEVSYNPQLFSLHYKGIDLFETEAEELIAELDKQSQYKRDEEEIPYGYLFPTLGMILWRPVVPHDYSEDEEWDEYRKGMYFMVVGIRT